MARVEIPFAVFAESEGNAAFIPGASVQVNNRDGSAATVYAQESEASSTTLPNPLTVSSNGRIEGWVDEGRYNLVVTGPGITTYTQPFDAKSAGATSRSGNAVVGDIGPAQEGGVGFGSGAPDTYIYRTTAGEWRTNSTARFDGEVRVNQARLVGTATSLALRDSGANNVVASLTSAGNFTDNSNATRLEFDTAARARAVFSGLGGIALARLGISATGVVLGNVAAGTLPIPTDNTLRVDYSGGRDTLSLSSTGTDTGITIGGDVELYRRAANVLSTPDTFEAVGYRVGTTDLASTHLSDTGNIGRLNATQTFTGANTFTGTLASNAAAAGTNVISTRVTGDSFARFVVTAGGDLAFGADGTATQDVHLGRGGADILRTPDAFQAGGAITARQGTTTNEIVLGAVGAGSTAGVQLGGDTLLYRSAADTFRTPDTLVVDASLLLGTTTQHGKITLASATTLAGGISFGDSATAKTDRVDLFRSAAGRVTLDGSITITGDLTVTGSTTQQTTQTSTGSLVGGQGQSGQVTLASAPTGNPTVVWGSGANAAEIYRDGNDKLRTPDALQADGLVTGLAGATFSGAPLSADRAAGTDVALQVLTGGVLRLRSLADGTLGWADGVGTVDTSLVRTTSGVLRLTGTLNSTLGYQVNGTALAASHLSNGTTGTGAVVLAASPTITGTLTVDTLAHGVSTSPLGTAAAPSRAFTGDSNTGMYSPGADQIGFATNGTARLTIAADGVVNAANGLTVGGTTVVLTDDARLSNSRTPTGTASGHLTGNYPNPSIASGVVTNDHISSSAAIADSKLATISTAGKVADTAIPATIARLASPTFTGVPGAPTAAVDTNTTQLATTAFVLGQASAAAPSMNGVAAVGTSLRYARQDHVHPTDTSRAPLSNPSFTGSYIEANNITYYTRHTSGIFSVLRSYVGDGALPNNADPRFDLDSYGTQTWRNGANPQVVTAYLVGGNNGFEFYAGEGTNKRLALNTTGVGFFSATPAAQSTGWGSPTEVTSVGSRAVLSASSTVNDLIRHVSALEAALKAYGLLGA